MANTQIYSVIPGSPFGRGTAGAGGTITSDPCARANAAGTSGGTSLTVGDVQGTFADGDLILIHQTRDSSDQDNWEVNKIVSGAATSSWTLANNLARTYTSQTGTTSAVRAQVVQIKEYSSLTIGNLTGTGWRATASYNGNGWGGLIAIAVTGNLAFSGTGTLNGAVGWGTTQDHNTSDANNYYTDSQVIGGGFRGGWNSTDSGSAAAGEGYTSSFESETTSAVASGGGGADNVGGGGGGGSATGGSGDFTGGAAAGNASLSRLWFGGGGGGGHNNGGNAASGGGGGGAWVIWAGNIDLTGGALQAKGGNGAAGSGGAPRPSGGGAGGSILINCGVGVFGSSLVNAGKGTKGASNAGDGSDGWVRINYGTSITGTTNPAASTNQDTNLVVSSGSASGPYSYFM